MQNLNVSHMLLTNPKITSKYELDNRWGLFTNSFLRSRSIQEGDQSSVHGILFRDFITIACLNHVNVYEVELLITFVTVKVDKS